MTTPPIGSFPVHVLADWQDAEFSAWSLGGAWNVNGFSALRGGGHTALWNGANGVGIYPNQSVDPDYVGAGTAKDDVATSPTVDLSLFPSADDWTFRFRFWFRPNSTAPTLGGDEHVPTEELRFILAPSASNAVEVVDLLDSPTELSWLGGSPWWYEQIITPKRAVQEAIAGDSALEIKLSFRVGARDATDFGIGIERVFVEVLRASLTDDESDPLEIAHYPGYTRFRQIT